MATVRKVVPEFGRSVELNDAFLEKHKDHMLVWIKHTVFNGKQGVEYRECRCYTCTKVAQEVLCEVSTEPQKKPEKEKKKDRKPVVQSRRKKKVDSLCTASD